MHSLLHPIVIISFVPLKKLCLRLHLPIFSLSISLCGCGDGYHKLHERENLELAITVVSEVLFEEILRS